MRVGLGADRTEDPEMKAGLRLDFDNLPLVEAAVRVSFESPVELTFSIVNGVHEHIGDNDFPQVSEPQQLEAPPGVGESAVALGPGKISGVVYMGGPQGLAVTLQSQVVVARWVKQVADESPPYPRFPALRDTAWKTVEAFAGVCQRATLPVAAVNMSYVNFLKTDDAAGVLKTYFSRLAQVQATERAAHIHKVEFSWREHDGTDLRFRLEKVTAQVGDEAIDGYRLTTIAGIRLTQPSDDSNEKLEHVHDRLQVFFRDLISEQAKKEWKLREPADA